MDCIYSRPYWFILIVWMWHISFDGAHAILGVICLPWHLTLKAALFGSYTTCMLSSPSPPLSFLLSLSLFPVYSLFHAATVHECGHTKTLVNYTWQLPLWMGISICHIVFCVKRQNMYITRHHQCLFGWSKLNAEEKTGL